VANPSCKSKGLACRLAVRSEKFQAKQLAAYGLNLTPNTSPLTPYPNELLAFFEMERDSPNARAILLQLEFFSTWLAEENVVDVACFLANEERGFLFLFALGHLCYNVLSTKIVRNRTDSKAYYGD
jgi:hypothetical protein